MNWEEVCEHPALHNLPFKIELNEYGEIIMNAVKVIHSLYQGEIEYLLRSLLKNGKTLPECAIKTEKGTKVADVAWASREGLKRSRTNPSARWRLKSVSKCAHPAIPTRQWKRKESCILPVEPRRSGFAETAP